MATTTRRARRPSARAVPGPVRATLCGYYLTGRVCSDSPQRAQSIEKKEAQSDVVLCPMCVLRGAFFGVELPQQLFEFAENQFRAITTD